MVAQRHIQVWSAGGDGTVMSVVELVDEYDIDFDLVYFSCIPFGTGNDFSQVLGWGRTIPHKDVLGNGLHHLEELVCDRLTHSEPARLDIWGVEMTSHSSGYVRLAGPERADGHDIPEIRNYDDISRYSFARKMSNYMSIGVQGYVGSGFEKHRAGNRLANMMVYTIESAKWVFWKHFPPVTAFIDEIVMDNKTVLRAPKPHEKKAAYNGSVPVMTKHPIDFVIQNIPHIWGREVDLWGEAKSGLECVSNRTGPTDPKTWKPQLANDGRMEIMAINTMASYIKKLANYRSHVSRLGQFQDPFEIRFRDPKERKSAQRLWRRNRYERENIICIMCDGEFYILKDPKVVSFKLHSTIWTLGRNDGHAQGRLVLD
ncbi:ATP-NAD kinase-like domain-containing protein [Dichotomocladium elegans]|nr:ATP-NAD kinase-like domain-containing protein [Dichotomocladium elegans]